MKLGLTGGIGCGKSTVVGLFAEAGFRTVESDEVVRDLLREDPAVREALRGRWGGRVFTDGGETDRKAIAAIVFGDEDELSWLESLLHPRVRKVWTGRLAASPGADWLVEIPLLFEKRLETEFDFTVCVSSPDAVVDARMGGRGFSGEEIERRRRKQLPLEAKRIRADYVISNAGSLQFLKRQTTQLIEDLRDLPTA
ncbi:MAG: dephospho-CoA kinase [Verrucomicrobiota bacterium]